MNIEPKTKGQRTIPAACIVGSIVVAQLMAGPAITSADESSSVAKVPPSKALGGVDHCPLCCPDDYIRKPSPSVSPVSSCSPDTYCSKPPLVLPSPEMSCYPDDYGPKPPPSPCRPMTNAWYKCVPLTPYPWLRPANNTGKTD
jgi:hypothetical protein